MKAVAFFLAHRLENPIAEVMIERIFAFLCPFLHLQKLFIHSEHM